MSVVIATYNRCETLKVTLAKLAEQTFPSSEFEVIVVDDGSLDDTPEVVSSLINRMPYSLRFYRHANQGPGATENRGIREAKAELVLLIADDIHATPILVESHVRYREKYLESEIAVLGNVLQSRDLPDTVFHKHWDPFRFKELTGKHELPYWKFWACNISVKRSFLLENGMFRELKGAAHEDVELGYRLHQKGLRVLFNEEALAYHYHVENLESAIERDYERGVHWPEMGESIPDAALHVEYDDLSWQTLKYHYSAVRSAAISKLPGHFVSYLFWEAVRLIMFNRFTFGAKQE